MPSGQLLAAALTQAKANRPHVVSRSRYLQPFYKVHAAALPIPYMGNPFRVQRHA
jgi:hypothetical protein